jgi:hypothetical protein
MPTINANRQLDDREPGRARANYRRIASSPRHLVPPAQQPWGRQEGPPQDESRAGYCPSLHAGLAGSGDPTDSGRQHHCDRIGDQAVAAVWLTLLRRSSRPRNTCPAGLRSDAVSVNAGAADRARLAARARSAVCCRPLCLPSTLPADTSGQHRGQNRGQNRQTTINSISVNPLLFLILHLSKETTTLYRTADPSVAWNWRISYPPHSIYLLRDHTADYCLPQLPKSQKIADSTRSSVFRS